MFRRKEDISPLSQLEQRLAYKTVQSGGDVPLHGLRKPAPERPKGKSPEIGIPFFFYRKATFFIFLKTFLIYDCTLYELSFFFWGVV